MGKTREDADACAAKKEKKAKKNKTKNDDLPDVGNGAGDGNGHVEMDDDLPKEKGYKHREKKRKSELNEDEDKHDKGNLVNDDLQKSDKKKKRRKQDSSENEQCQDDETAGERDCDPKLGKKKTSDGKETDLFMEDCQQEDMFEKTDEKKKRKKDSSEKTRMDENEQRQHDEITVEKDCEPKTREKKTRDGKGTEISMEGCQEDEFEKTDKKKKRKKKNIDTQNPDTEINGIMTEASTLNTQDKEDSNGSKGNKKTKSVESSEKQKVKVKSKKVNKKMTESVEKNNTEISKAKGKSKKVSFASQVEVFPSSDTEPNKQQTKRDGLVRGKRFTPEEDGIVKQAVLDYVEAHDLGEEGLKMVLHCNSHTGMKKCWQEIGTCIPYRPYTAVYSRAHILFERSENRSWTPEEIELLKEYHKKHGNDWKKLADELGKHRFHVKDTWRRIKFENLKLGKWSQEEYQSLYDLVNIDLQMKINSEKKSKHGMLRDNIPWTAISEKLSTRSDSTCCVKWYNQLTSSLVAEKKWSDADDYRMIGALYELDAACVEDVDWDNLLAHRPGDICRKRWDQMVKHIDHGSKPFAEQVDTLAKRYCPVLAETREAWDNKPVVP